MKTHWKHHIPNRPSNFFRAIRFYFLYPREIYYAAKYFIFPRQRWIKKYIRYNTYCDTSGLIPDFVFGSIIQIVEQDKIFDRVLVDMDLYGNILNEVYEYAKNGRNNNEIKCEKALKDWSETFKTSFVETEACKNGGLEMLREIPDKELERKLNKELKEIESNKEKQEKEMLIKAISIYEYLYV